MSESTGLIANEEIDHRIDRFVGLGWPQSDWVLIFGLTGGWVDLWTGLWIEQGEFRLAISGVI